MKIYPNVIKHAASVAATSKVVRAKIAAVLFCGGKVYTSAVNTRYDGIEGVFTLHAEAFLLAKMARLKLKDRLVNKRFGVLVVRWRPSNKSLANSKPCAACQILLRKAGLKVYYSDSDGEIQELRHG